MLESKFKSKFKKELIERLPNVEFFEPDPERKRSAPDLMIFNERGWAALEFKRSEKASHRPNQDLNIQRLGKKGYASFVYPENEEAVFHDLEKLLTP